ncbi:MAG: transcriptional repressor LexA [Deltaproteobacteria bacterium]|nr:transcriptional repressor LexA [Deltaproteobacteria bacterium]
MVRTSSEKLTKSQRRLLETIHEFMTRNGFPPSTRELAASLEIKAPSVHEQLKKLESKGFIRRSPYKARSIEILKTEYLSGSSDGSITTSIPVLGEIAAGIPIFAEENHQGTITIDEELSSGGRHFALHVRGDSMVNCGINDGDFVVIRQQPVAEPGEIIAALIGDEATVKRLKIINEKVFLIPENKKYRPIDVTYREDFRIIGKVITWVKPQDL